MIAILTFLLFLGIVLIFLTQFLRKFKTKSLDDLHVVVTGGSSGIGKSVAIEAAKRGAHVTLIARDVEKLEMARSEVTRHCLRPGQQRIQHISLDVSGNYETIEQALHAAEEDVGPVYMLVNCAGMALCGRLEDCPIQDIKNLVDLNLLGTLYPTRAVIAGMKVRREGVVVMVASQAALVGIYGYSVYSSTKFALRGLAEALHMETKPYNVSVTLSLPPDTDTPGFAQEEKTKPLETRLISESAGLVTPDTVAKQLVKDALEGNFYSTVGFEGFILTTVSAGMSPVSSLLELTLQVLLMGVLRVVSVGYLISFHRIIRNCMKTRDKTKKSE